MLNAMNIVCKCQWKDPFEAQKNKLINEMRLLFALVDNDFENVSVKLKAHKLDTSPLITILTRVIDGTILCKTKLGDACILPNLRNLDNNW